MDQAGERRERPRRIKSSKCEKGKNRKLERESKKCQIFYTIKLNVIGVRAIREFEKAA